MIPTWQADIAEALSPLEGLLAVEGYNYELLRLRAIRDGERLEFEDLPEVEPDPAAEEPQSTKRKNMWPRLRRTTTLPCSMTTPTNLAPDRGRAKTPDAAADAPAIAPGASRRLDLRLSPR